MIKYLKQTEHIQLQFEAAWSLANISAGATTHIEKILDKNIISVFILTLANQHEHIVEQVIIALGNIAGDSATYRDLIISSQGVTQIIKIL